MRITLPEVPTSLKELMKKENPYVTGVILQSDKANTDDIFFGPKNEVHHFIEVGKSATIPLSTLSSYFAYGGAASQVLIVTSIKS